MTKIVKKGIWNMKIEISNDEFRKLLDYIEAENKCDENIEVANIAQKISGNNKTEPKTIIII